VGGADRDPAGPVGEIAKLEEPNEIRVVFSEPRDEAEIMAR